MSIPLLEYLQSLKAGPSLISQQLDNLRLQSSPQTAAGVQLIEDSFDSGHNYQSALSRTGVLCFGRIQMAMPYANCYRVAIESLGGVVPCTRLLPDTTPGLFGVGDAAVLEPDAAVLVYVLPGTKVPGVILGCLPEPVWDGNDSFSDSVVQASNCGLLRSVYYRDYISLLADEGGIADRSNNRALDELIYDWGRTTETGIRLHIDPFLCMLRVNEFCGVFGFYDPTGAGLLRIRGYKLETESAAHSEFYNDDEGEATYFRGETPYPWEANGCFSPSADNFREVEDNDVIHKGIESKIEPKEADQMPFFRYREYGGYLGQGRLRMQVLPPADLVDSETPYTYSQHDKPERGVFREQVQMDGQYILESAKGIVIAKRRFFPVPKQIRLPDDQTDEADSSANNNYKFAGKHGDGGDEHKIGDLTTQDSRRHMLMAAAILDVHAYLFNWKAQHPFVYHRGDYSVPEESTLAEDVEPYTPDYSELKTKWWLPEPDVAAAVKVDHRYTDSEHYARYYSVLSHVQLNDDGSISIVGGQGEEIRMLGGNIEISCPGSVFLRPGKSAITLAGDDAVIRAYKSVDITSSQADVRLKAENNMQLISGNGTAGGCLLLENRSTAVKHDYPEEGGEAIRGSGVIIKAPVTEFAAMAKDIYLRTGSSPNVLGGSITLDADTGYGHVRTVASVIDNYVKLAVNDNFGFPTVSAVNQYTAAGNILGSQLRVDGLGYFDGTGAFNGSVYAVEGEYFSRDGRAVSAIMDRDLWLQRMQQIGDDETQKRDDNQKYYEEVFTEGLYADGAIGNEEMQRKISGSLRTEEDYGTSELIILQSCWQAIDTRAQAGVAWEESTVNYQPRATGSGGVEQHPWPGKDIWEGDTMLALEDSEYKFYDVANGVAKDRTDPAYEAQELGQLKLKKPSEEFKIIPVD